MNVINHFLFGVCISLGFAIGFLPRFDKKKLLVIIFLIGGFAIGVSAHMWQDSLAYSKEGFLDSTVYLKPHQITGVEQALCMVFYNNNDYCRKYVPAPKPPKGPPETG